MGFFDFLQQPLLPPQLPHGSQSPVQAGGLTVDPQAVRRFLGTPETADAATARAGEGNVQGGPTDFLGQLGQTIGDLGRGLSQEGLGGLLDLSGMMDRQQAQRDLSNRFQVVGDDFVGPRNHNQVSQEEYERIAHTYSDIRLGRGDLTVNTSEMTPGSQQETDYRSGAMNAIADMMMTTSGRRQIMNMSNNVARDDAGNARTDAAGNEIHHHTTIRAFYNDANGDRNYTNDPHGPGDYYNGNAMATATGATIADRQRDFPKWYRDETTGARGEGADSTIYWNPTAHVDDCDRADVILAHEMQHAMHETQGTMARGDYSNPGGPDDGISNYERQAVGLPHGGHYPGDDDGCTENTYRAERNQLGLGDNLANRDHYDGRMPGNRPTPP